MCCQNVGPLLDAQIEALLDRSEEDRAGAVPKTASQAARMGELVKAGYLVRLMPGIYTRSQTVASWNGNPRVAAYWLARAYSSAHPDKVLCSFSAAVVQGLWLSYAFLGTLYVVATKGETTHRSPHVFYRKIKQFDKVTCGGVSVTNIEQTVLDCVLAAPFAEGLAIADSALRYFDLSNENLLAYFRRCGKRRPGIRRALAVARYASKDAENGGESIVRGLIIAAGYMPPTMLQVEFVDPVDGERTIRVDGFFALGGGRGVILEVDGMAKYPHLRDGEGGWESGEGHALGAGGAGYRDLRSVLVDERQRESHITALGYPVMRVLFRRVREPDYLVSLLRAYGIPQVQDPLPFA